MRARHGDGAFRQKLTPIGSVGHLLATNDLGVRVDRACRELGWTMEWHGSEDLQDFVRLVGVLPDAFFKIVRPTADGPRRAGFFVELERAEKSTRVVRMKLERYAELNLRHHDAYAQKFGTNAMRVLFVFAAVDPQSAQRRVEAGVSDARRIGFTRARFAALSSVNRMPVDRCLLSPVWRGIDGELLSLFSGTVAASDSSMLGEDGRSSG